MNVFRLNRSMSSQPHRNEKYQSLMDFLVTEALRSKQYCSPALNSLALTIAIAMPVSALIESHIAPESPSTTGIRLIAMMLCIGVVALSDFWSTSPVLQAFYWIFAVSFTGIFLFTQLLLTNAAESNETSEINNIWLMQYFVAMFVSMQVLANRMLFFICWIGATLASVCSLAFVSDPDWGAIQNYVVFAAPVLLTALIFGSSTSRVSSVIAKEKHQTAVSIGLNIAHELRTPLASMRSISDASNRHIPNLLEGYEKAREAGLLENPLTATQLNTVANSMANVKSEVRYSNTIIDMLLVSTSDKPRLERNPEPSSITECIEDAVARFPFNNDVEKNAVVVSIEDEYQVNAAQLLVVHMLFNLIKNAVRFAVYADVPRVHLRAYETASGKVLSIRDSGPGINKNQKRLIFERFYTTQGFGQGTGIGLSFCKSAMESLGGSIECHSDGATFTEFRLTFP